MSAKARNQFGWDEGKRETTLLKHGIDFLDAIRIFDGRPVVHARSHRPDEQRWVAGGNPGGRIISVDFTFRDDAIRITTARRAGKHEKRHDNAYYAGGSDPPQG